MYSPKKPLLPIPQDRKPSPEAIEILAKILVNRHKRLQREELKKTKAEKKAAASMMPESNIVECVNTPTGELFAAPSSKLAKKPPQLKLNLQRSGTLNSQKEMWEERDLDWPS